MIIIISCVFLISCLFYVLLQHIYNLSSYENEYINKK